MPPSRSIPQGIRKIGNGVFYLIISLLSSRNFPIAQYFNGFSVGLFGIPERERTRLVRRHEHPRAVEDLDGRVVLDEVMRLRERGVRDEEYEIGERCLGHERHEVLLDRERSL